MTLNPQQEAFALSIASGASTAEAGASIGISARTARRWRDLPEISAAINDHRKQLTDSALGRLQGALMVAVDTLAGIAQDTAAPPSARVSAARGILESALRLREQTELVQKIEEIERRLALSPAGSVPA